MSSFTFTHHCTETMCRLFPSWCFGFTGSLVSDLNLSVWQGKTNHRQNHAKFQTVFTWAVKSLQIPEGKWLKSIKADAVSLLVRSVLRCWNVIFVFPLGRLWGITWRRKMIKQCSYYTQKLHRSPMAMRKGWIGTLIIGILWIACVCLCVFERHWEGNLCRFK